MYMPRNYRHYWTLLILMALELPFTILILTFTGIASHNRYRTKLWQDGYDNGFNSAPDQIVYALANYRPYTIPVVWSSFITNFNLVIGVVGVFLLIAKVPTHLLRAFYPPLSVVIHGSLVALYMVSARFQAGSDTTDPQHPQPGPPWYITKNCNVAAHKSNIGYCQQAKALFATTIVILVIYFAELVLSVISCFSTKEEQEKRRERREEKRALKEWEDMVLKSPSMIPMTPAPPTGRMPPVTPRTLAFNRLTGESSDLPLRNHPSSSPGSPSTQQATVEASSMTSPSPPPQLYFPPPPKKALSK